MSHHKHTTDAFIMSSTPYREHDARVKMVTKDGEVLTAVATGLRTLTSKLRMAITPYARASVSLIKGKDSWRLTNAQSHENYFTAITDKEAKKALARTVFLVEKLTPGEAHVGVIFEQLCLYASALASEISSEYIKAYEAQAALNILAELGYIENNDKWSNVDIDYILTHINEAVKDINFGIKSTHLV